MTFKYFQELSLTIILGVYGYGAKTTTPDNRATTLGRYDGFELIARVLGALLSPIIANQMTRYGNFGLKLGCDLIALLYLAFIIKETPRMIDTREGPVSGNQEAAQIFIK